jgi:hypothetical protein
VRRIILIATIFGGTLMLGGVLAALSTVGHAGEDMLRSFGLLLLSVGAMCVAIPLYLEALKIRSQFRRTEEAAPKRNLSPCAICSAPAATFWCTTHMMRLCPECIARHDDAARCLYRTFGRVAAAAKSPAGQTSRT